LTEHLSRAASPGGAPDILLVRKVTHRSLALAQPE
jgi:hypothetical protein